MHRAGADLNAMARSCLYTMVCEEFERRYLLQELTDHGWNRKSTASDLGLSYRALLRHLHRLAITRPEKPIEGAA